MIQRRRKSRLRARRSRNANAPARTSVSLAVRYSLRRPPTNPSARLNIRRLALVRAAPFMARMECVLPVWHGKAPQHRLRRWLPACVLWSVAIPSVAWVSSVPFFGRWDHCDAWDQCHKWGRPSPPLAAMPRQRPRDLLQHGLADDPRAAEVAAGLLRRPRGQMARPRLTVLGFAAGRQAKPLFRSLVRLLLGHGRPGPPGACWLLESPAV